MHSHAKPHFLTPTVVAVVVVAAVVGLIGASSVIDRVSR
jgi:hypothetical protein